MNVNVNEFAAKLEPWSFQIQQDEGVYPVRRLALADLAIFEKAMASITGGELAAIQDGMKGLRDALLSVITSDAKPPVEEWEDVVLVAMVRSLLDYFRERSKKNVQALGTAAAATEAAKTTSP